MPPKHVRPTHFLAFPIADPACQARCQEINNILLQAKPRPDGVDESLAGLPRSLHLTLSIMALSTDSAAMDKQQIQGSEGKRMSRVEDAASLLRDCRKDLRQLLEEAAVKDIRVNLNRLESFQSDPTKCRVLYAEPEKGSPGVETLHQLAAYIRERFHNEGMLSDYKQSLTLHCTLMKASARKSFPQKQGRRQQPVDVRFRDKQADKDTTTSESEDSEVPNPILEAEGEALVGEKAIGTLESGIKPKSGGIFKPPSKRHRKRVPKNYPFDASLVLNANPPYALGETSIDSIHLYQMGKKDRQGAYVVLEEIRLFD